MTLAKPPEGDFRFDVFFHKEDCQKQCDELYEECHRNADPCNAGSIGYV